MKDISHPKRRGQCSEAAVLFEFTRNGITVLEPFGDNERYDFVVELGGRFFRVQVKTGRLTNGRVQFETRSSGTLTRRVKKEGYDGQIDIFAVYSPDLEQAYVIPIDDAPSTSMGLRVENANKKSPNINWADDFRLSDWIEQHQFAEPQLSD
ncbi:group I intron-associated PD-(D/E)XK endonuclease [Haloferax sp. S1W]|uniref:group I intron-associated PD-(D/E)XK endonuclease n=1 Tax=Haloferax sp. S1W TaxID=3377110 RepID=UPI0037C6A112